MMIQLTQSNKDKAEIAMDECALEHGSSAKVAVGELNEHATAIGMDSFADCLNNQHSGNTRKRRKNDKNSEHETYISSSQQDLQNRERHWKRIILLITAVTIHNIPGTLNKINL
jgi:solute carrier family 39 (zinc transporter), member 11